MNELQNFPPQPSLSGEKFNMSQERRSEQQEEEEDGGLDEVLSCISVCTLFLTLLLYIVWFCKKYTFDTYSGQLSLYINFEVFF